MYQVPLMRHFNLYDLVPRDVFELLGSNAWALLNTDLCRDLDKFVDDLIHQTSCTGVVINNWNKDGWYEESGFRVYDSGTGSRKSQHKQGNAFDLKFIGIDLVTAYQFLIANQTRYPSIKRVEDISYTTRDNEYGGWLHIDGKDTHSKGLYVFKP